MIKLLINRWSGGLAGALMLMTSGTGVLLADTYPKNPALDVDNYRFEIELFEAERRIEVRTTVTIAVKGQGVTEVALDLVDADDNAEGMSVERVTVDGEKARLVHRDSRLTIALAQPAVPGSVLVVSIDYQGVPKDALGIGANKHGTWSWFSDNWPNKARHWLATVDHPYDKATSDMIVTAPSQYQVISNGALVEERDLKNGQRLTHWQESVPIATWLYTLGVTEFAVQHLRPFDGKPVETWVFAQDRDAGFYDFAEPTHHALDFYSEHVGPYSYEKLANVQSARTKGGMEAASAIMYDDRSVTGTRDKRWRNVVIHEIAHQWFGNAVTEADWDDVWLSEGFATYFTLLFIEHAYGRDEFVAGLKLSRERIFRAYAQNPDERIVHDNLDDMSRVTTGNTYQKGAWTLHMLRSMIGDTAFWKGIRDYYARFQDRNATTRDFRHAMERASGLELEWFFDQWLRRGGGLLIDWSSHFDAARGALSIRIEQTQAEASYRVQLPIRVEYRDPTSDSLVLQTETVWVEGRVQQFQIELPAQPVQVVIDPDVTVLVQLSERNQ